MNILFLEPRATGHRMRYLGNLVREALSRGYRVSLGTTAEAQDSQAFQQFVDPDERVNVFLSKASSRRNRWSLPQSDLYEWFRSTFAVVQARQQVDLVFVPYLNYIDKLVAIKGSPFGAVPWSGIVMKESFHHFKLGLRPDKERFSFIREQLFRRLLQEKYVQSVITIDETLPEYLKHSRCSEKLVYVPDPADANSPIERHLACQRLDLPEDRFYVLCYGHIDDRKGVLDLLDAVQGRPEFDDVTVVIAGRREPQIDGAIRARVERWSGGPKIVELNRFIDSEEEQCLFSIAGAVWVGYKGHFGSSGILGQAAGAGKPVIACEVGLIGFTTRRHGLGLCININDHTGVRAALSRLKNDAEFLASCVDACAAFSSARTTALFRAKAIASLERIGNSASMFIPHDMKSTRTNILIVHNHPIHYKTMLFEALGRLRNDIHVLYVSSSSVIRNKKADLSKEQYSFSVASDTAFESMAANLAVFRIISTIFVERPRILVTCGYHHFAFWVSVITAKLLGAKVVLWYESNEFDHDRVFWKELIKRAFMKMCDFAQVYGTSNKEYLLKLGLREDQVSVKMAVVDVARFKAIRPNIGKRPQRTLIYVGRLSEEKNLRALVEALDRVNRENPEKPLFLRIVGYGPQESELRALVAARALEGRVEFCGPKLQEELKTIFADGDGLILPSTREPWGLTILEAMCAGLPVIASDRCGCTKDVIRPETGWQFEAKSVNSLCAALRHLQNASTDELVAKGEAGRKIGVEYDADNSARRTARLFTGILGGEKGLGSDEQDQTRFVLSR
jgi:glycosyltransferase involved in cell wall biosynthesis